MVLIIILKLELRGLVWVDLVMVHIALVLTWWMSDVEIHHFCLGDMVELVMVLNVVFTFVLWSHMEIHVQSS